ncbi:MAG: thiolase family protein [Planctomycetota bacterium]
MSQRILIVAARRTAFGRFRGRLAAHSPVSLATAVANAVCSDVDVSQISQIILGQVLAAGHGMNPARQVSLSAGLPETSTAVTLNMMCGSGLKALALGAQAIRAGEARAVLAGGVESMSQSPLLIQRPGRGQQPDVTQLRDSMVTDGLRDVRIDQHMGDTAERLAREFGISRAEQDAWALRSQSCFAAAHVAGHFADELVGLPELAVDEHPRPDVTVEELAGLKPVFADDGTVTAGNSSGINDGAALVVLAEESLVRERRWPVLCEWVGVAESGCDPQRMGLGPVHALRTLLQKQQISLSAIDQLEINEAFAAQVLACLHELQLTSTGSAALTASGRPVVNPHGGAIAVGHPLSASGARLAVHLAWQIARGRAQTAACALCIGGGMGIAALLRAADGF